MRRIDTGTGLPIEAAEKLKVWLEALEEEDLKLKNQNIFLERKIAEIENGSLGVRRISDERGGGIEFSPSEELTIRLTLEGVLKPPDRNILKIGDLDAYLNDVVTANITIGSSVDDKTEIRELNEAELEKIVFPKPKKYKRKIGQSREEIGFIAEELPEIVRRENGYDLKALIAILVWKISRLEEKLNKNNTR